MPETKFYELLLVDLPRLRAFARSITRDKTAADDLLQDTITLGLAGFIRSLQGPILETVDEAFLGKAGSQEMGLTLKELKIGIAKLSPPQREALLLVTVGEHS